ncbi:hypothetical protein M0R04_06855 [Candidatus Dojkabacteria bacterium]|jgi:hypothetical protein|nr:hypothetical protein [Candidatus Dojkabacteria bacterium]
MKLDKQVQHIVNLWAAGYHPALQESVIKSTINNCKRLQQGYENILDENTKLRDKIKILEQRNYK